MGTSNFTFLPLRETPDNHPNAHKDEGDAEPLAHVEDHVFLEFHLYVLQKLDADARAEDDDEEGAEHQAGLLVAKVALVVHPQEDAHRHEAEEGLVKTRGVARQPLARGTRRLPRVAGGVVVDSATKLLRAAQEDEAPWQ